MLLGEHSAILSTFIKQPFDIKIFVLSFFFLSGGLGQVLLNPYIPVVRSYLISLIPGLWAGPISEGILYLQGVTDGAMKKGALGVPENIFLSYVK